MRVQGRCHCGRITYEAEIDPEDVSICHCTDCQMLTGSAYRVTVRAPGAGFRLLAGHGDLHQDRRKRCAARAFVLRELRHTHVCPCRREPDHLFPAHRLPGAAGGTAAQAEMVRVVAAVVREHRPRPGTGSSMSQSAARRRPHACASRQTPRQ